MLVPYEWLRELVCDLPGAGEVAEALTMVGLNVEGAESSVAGPVLNVEVTANRPDCLSVLGVAREAAAALGKELQPGATLSRLGACEPPAKGAAADGPVEIAGPDVDLCGRYVGMVIEDVRIGPSPPWLADRLLACGVRPILNIVDVTNYVMLEMGQPLHAFDLDTLAEGRIIVRRAREGERLTTLDGEERALEPDMLLITDPGGPVAIAGVMGGLSTEVTGSTGRVLIESANFNPRSIWRTGRKLGLDTEASLRFKRGVDACGAGVAVQRVAELVLEIRVGRPVTERIYDAFPAGCAKTALELRVDRVNELLGTELAAGTVRSILERLGFGVTMRPGGYSVEVGVPSYRGDVRREIDLVEEVARLHGYSRIPVTLLSGQPPVTDPDPLRAVERAVRQTLCGCGLSEVISLPLVSPRELQGFPAGDSGCESGKTGGTVESAPGAASRGGPVRLLNPLSEELSVMRTTLLPGLLKCLARNLERRNQNLALFELGRVYTAEPCPPEPARERRLVAGVICGLFEQGAWNRPARAADFYDLKACLESLLGSLKVDERSVRFRAEAPGFLVSGRSATVTVRDVTGERGGAGSELHLGCLGEVSPAVTGSFGIGQGPVWAFEVDLEALAAVSRAVGGVRYAPVPRFPPATRDVAVVVPKGVTCGSVLEAVRRAGGELLEGARLFDVYEGPQVPEGKRSLAFSLSYRAGDRTLTVAEVEQAHARVVEALIAGMGLSLRA